MNPALIPEDIVIAILAAGQSIRFGGGKLDAVFSGRKLGSIALDKAVTLGRGKIAIVTGNAIPIFAQEASQQGHAEILHNPYAAAGLGTSVALAARYALSLRASALLIMPGDMPLISEATLRALTASRSQPAAVRYQDGRAGIPAAFPANWFSTLAELKGSGGAGSLLNNTPDLHLIEVPSGELRDIDTREDLATLEAELAKQTLSSSPEGKEGKPLTRDHPD